MAKKLGYDVSKKFDIKELSREANLNNNWKLGFPSFMYGINVTDDKYPLKPNKDFKKLVFFTRPQLNMRTENLIRSEATQKLLHNKATTLNNYVRHLLDPRLRFTEKPVARSPILDDTNPFIVPFTNGLISLTGWTDVETPTTTSKVGRLGEQHTMLDGDNNSFGTYTLNATFDNLEGNPISQIISGWQDVAVSSYVGPGMPYFDLVLADELEYTTRIYVIIIGDAGMQIKNIACAGSAIIKSNPVGKRYDVTGTNPRNDNKTESYNIVCDGFEYDDPRIVDDFNRTCAMFNKDLRDLYETGSTNLIKTNPEISRELRGRSVPYINPDTMELEWYISKDYLKDE